MDASSDLFIRANEPIANERLIDWVRVRDADVVDAFEDHRILDTGLRKDISVDSADYVWSEAIMQDAVSSCCLVEHCYGRCTWVTLHLCEYKVRPAAYGQPILLFMITINNIPVRRQTRVPVVHVGIATTTISDTVSYDSKPARFLRNPSLNGTEEIPMMMMILFIS